MTLTGAGIKSFQVWTSGNRFAGIVAWNEKRDAYQVCWNMNCTRGSKRWFATVDDAVSFIEARRVRKGWAI